MADGISIVARTILAQLGGRRFLAMTGAKLLLSEEMALRIHLPSHFAKEGINRVRIELTCMDLYDVTFSTVRSGETVYETCVADVDAETLSGVFEDVTGLHLRL